MYKEYLPLILSHLDQETPVHDHAKKLLIVLKDQEVIPITKLTHSAAAPLRLIHYLALTCYVVERNKGEREVCIKLSVIGQELVKEFESVWATELSVKEDLDGEPFETLSTTENSTEPFLQLIDPNDLPNNPVEN